jgi:hypothetical protein
MLIPSAETVAICCRSVHRKADGAVVVSIIAVIRAGDMVAHLRAIIGLRYGVEAPVGRAGGKKVARW